MPGNLAMILYAKAKLGNAKAFHLKHQGVFLKCLDVSSVPFSKIERRHAFAFIDDSYIG